MPVVRPGSAGGNPLRCHRRGRRCFLPRFHRRCLSDCPSPDRGCCPVGHRGSEIVEESHIGRILLNQERQRGKAG